MKTMVWVSAVILAILVGGLAVNHYLERTAAELSQQIEQVQQLVRLSQWAQAEADLQQVNGHWQQVRGVWAAIIRHQEIDELEKSFGRITQLIATRDRGLTLAELETAKLLIEHIPDKERVLLSNIL